MPKCYVCQGEGPHVTEMTDGRTSYDVCDSCRPFVNLLFHVHGSLNTAVREAVQAKRGSKD